MRKRHLHSKRSIGPGRVLGPRLQRPGAWLDPIYWDLQSIFINFPNSNGAQPTDNAFRIDERWVTALIDNIKRWNLLTCLRLLRADGGVKTSEFSQRSRILVLMTKEVCLKAQGGSPQITDPISYYRLSCDLYYRN